MTVIRINGSSTGNQPQGSDVQGDVSLALNDLTNVDATTNLANNSIIKYNSSANQWQIGSDTDTGLTAVVQDTDPQLGGDLDVNGQQLVTTSNGNIVLAPNGTGQTQITGGTTNETPLQVKYEDDGASAGPKINLIRVSSSPANGDNIGAIMFKGKDDAGNTDTYASIVGEIEKKNSGGERGRIDFNVIANGSEETIATMNRNGLFFASGNKIAFAGTTDNNNFVTLQAATDPAGFRTIGLPDSDGTVMLNLSEDTNPQLGGNLDINGNKIVSTSNGNIEIDPNGTGRVKLLSRTDIEGTGADNHTVFISTDMSADTSEDLHNAIQCNADYTGINIGSSTKQQSITFGFDDDGGSEQAGRFNCEFTRTDTTSNKMKLIAIDYSASNPSNGQIDITPKRAKVNKPFEFESYTVANLPTNVGAGAMAYCTDETGGAVPVFYDGSAWRRVTDRAVAS